MPRKTERSIWGPLNLASVAIVGLAVVLVNGVHTGPSSSPAQSPTRPSDRISGCWYNARCGNLVFYDLSDPALKIGTVRVCNNVDNGFGPSFRFEVVSEQPSQGTFVIHEFWDLAVWNALYGLNLHEKSDITCRISEDGQRMTQGYTYPGEQILDVLERVDLEVRTQH